MKIQILGNDPQGIKLKDIDGEVQEFDNLIEIESYKFYVNKRVITDYIEKLIDIYSYIKIENMIFKILKINTYSDYQEVWLYELIRQQAVL